MTDQNQLVAVVEQSSLPQPKVQALMATFAPAFQEAKQLAEAAKGIAVTDEADTATMQLARENRLKLKNLRVSVEKTRKELKEQSLREGKAIDGAANIIKALVEPVEEYLEKQEKFAEHKEAERLEAKYQDRLKKISPYVTDPTLYKLKEMSDAAFDQLLTDAKAAKAAQEEAAKKAEAERLELERKQKVFTERRIALAPYQDFINNGTENFQLSTETPEEVYQEVLTRAKARKQKNDEEQAAIAAQAKKDREAREKAERELKAQQEAQAKAEREAKAKADAEAKAKAEAEQKALLAPDKEKLMDLVGALQEIKTPAVKSKQANDVLVEFGQRMRVIEDWLYEEASKL